MVRYKVRLVAQGFLQRLDIDFDQTYSPIMDGITFHYLISLAINMDLDMQLMDVVTAYLFRSLDAHIYMKILNELRFPRSKKKKIATCITLNCKGI